jgi:hypothetical protein
MTLAQQSLQIAIAQLGVCEQPRNSNMGPEVNQYLRSVGLRPGYPWCMAFVYWCVEQACQKSGRTNPMVRTGGVMRQWNETKLRKLSHRDRAIKAGDVFIMRFARGTGHTGFVKEVHPGRIVTIEGNTNDEGSREGYEVAQRERLLSTMHGIIQIS